MTRNDENPNHRQGNMECLILDIAVQRRRMATDALIAEAVWDSEDEPAIKAAALGI